MLAPPTRRVRPELMDQPDLDVREHHHALQALGRANAVSFNAETIWPAIRDVAAAIAGRPVRILDVACGGGQVAVSIARRAAAAGIQADVIGCDVSPVAIDYARRLARQAGAARVEFVQSDVLKDPLPEGVDAVFCSLFLHHLDDEAAGMLLRRLKACAGRVAVVSDLRRTSLGYLFAWVGCRLLSRSRVFHVDGTRSVEAAFTTGEALALARRAGWSGATMTQRWPQRWVLVWKR